MGCCVVTDVNNVTDFCFNDVVSMVNASRFDSEDRLIWMKRNFADQLIGG